MEFMEVLQNRRSVRSYTGAAVPEEKLKAILQSGLLSASSRAIRPWELIIVRDKEMLSKLSNCRDGSAKMLEGAEAAIVVIGDENLSDVWVEDCSIVMSNMHLMADSLGIGSCWIQGRLRETSSGMMTEEYVRNCLGFPQNFRLEAILSLGMPKGSLARREISDLHTEKIHYEKF